MSAVISEIRTYSRRIRTVGGSVADDMETDIDVLGPTRNSVNGLAGGFYSALVAAIEIVCRHSVFSMFSIAR